jgi:hypothetical protein
MTGKSFLLSLLNGNSNIACYPFHKFGISPEHFKIKNYLLKRTTTHPYARKYFEYNERNKIKIKLYNEKQIYKINISELVLFILNNNNSIPYMLESHSTKKLPIFAGDSYYEYINIDFDFNLFINSIEKNIDLYRQEIFELEDLDNIIYNSFLNSTDQYNSNSLHYKYYCQCTSNSLDEINFLLKYYKNLKLIYIKRDLVSGSFSIAKRLSSKKFDLPSKNHLKKIMFNYASERKIKEDIFFDSVIKNSNKNKLLIVNFEDIFNKRSELMHKISDFLEIKFEDTMMRPHMMNYKTNNSNFLKNNMNDDPNELFSKKEINDINDIFNSKLKLFFYKNLYRVLLKIRFLK